MLRIVMDGAGDVPEGWLEKYDIQLIPVNIHFENKAYTQGVDLSEEDFYRLADSGKTIPKTSQPTPQQFVDFYRRIANLGDTILSIHVTSKLSGTYESAVAAARELAEHYKIVTFDSATGSAALGYMCKEARMLDQAGASLQRILERLDHIRSHVAITLTLETLEYARKSGRVKAMQAAVASILQVKPIVILKEGALIMADRVRSRNRSIEHIVELVSQEMGKQLVNIAVVHARAPQAAQDIKDRLIQLLNLNEIIVTQLSIGVAANLGPGTVGIVAYPVEEG